VILRAAVIWAALAALAPRGAAAGGPGAAGEPGAAGSERGLALRAVKALCVPAEGPQVIDDALVLVKDGRIEAVGRARALEVPDGYEVLDFGELWLTPGLVDLHVHTAGALGDLNDMVYLTNPGLRASTTVTPRNPAIARSLAGGVTSMLLVPGSGTNMGGQAVLVKNGLAHYEESEIRNPGALKLAQAGNPERYLFQVGRSFMNWNTRNTFLRGLAYARKWARFEKEGGEEPEVDLQFEVFRDLLAKRTQVAVHTQIYQVVMMTVLMVKREMGLDVYIDHGTFDGWRAAPLAQEFGVPAILGPRNISRHYSGFIDTDGQIQGVAAKYQEGGLEMIGFNTDAPVIPGEDLSVQAAMGVRYGFELDHLETVRGLTIIPALTAGIADRVGSLEPGKDADILVVTGDPADPRTSVEIVFVEGRRVYDAAHKRIY